LQVGLASEAWRGSICNSSTGLFRRAVVNQKDLFGSKIGRKDMGFKGEIIMCPKGD